MKPHKLYTFSK